MLTDPTSRRAFLAAAGAAFGSAWLAATPEDVQASLAHAGRAARGQQPAFEVFTAEQAADVDAIASQILPTDDQLPGAHEAGAVYFIDHSLTAWAQGQRQQTITGLAAFNGLVGQQYAGRRFAELTVAQQLAFLQANERNGFFQQIRGAVLIATFANPKWGGNRNKAGYRILGFEDRYVWQPPFGWYDARANGGEN